MNPDFDKLSESDQRVAIAKDVIAQVDQKRFHASQGTYLWVNEDKIEPGVPIADQIAGQACRVCALGALFVSKVESVNGVTPQDLASITKIVRYNWAALCQTEMAKYLSDIFSKKQLQQIECAFEIDYDGCSCGLQDLTLDEKERAASFGDEFPESNNRLLAIMKNIVGNDGEFIP